jgi:hypothetical protein
MIYRGPGSRAVVCFGSSPSPVSKLDRRHTGRLRKREQNADGREGRGWRRRQIIRRRVSLVLQKSFITVLSANKVPATWPARKEGCLA